MRLQNALYGVARVNAELELSHSGRRKQRLVIPDELVDSSYCFALVELALPSGAIFAWTIEVDLQSSKSIALELPVHPLAKLQTRVDSREDDFPVGMEVQAVFTSPAGEDDRVHASGGNMVVSRCQEGGLLDFGVVAAGTYKLVAIVPDLAWVMDSSGIVSTPGKVEKYERRMAVRRLEPGAWFSARIVNQSHEELVQSEVIGPWPDNAVLHPDGTLAAYGPWRVDGLQSVSPSSIEMEIPIRQNAHNGVIQIFGPFADEEVGELGPQELRARWTRDVLHTQREWELIIQIWDISGETNYAEWHIAQIPLGSTLEVIQEHFLPKTLKPHQRVRSVSIYPSLTWSSVFLLEPAFRIDAVERAE